MIKLKKGLDLPINGKPTRDVSDAPKPKEMSVVGTDFVGMKPTMKVQVGDEVKIGDILFSCKKNTGVVYTSPANGKVLSVNRGARRAFQSITVSCEGNDHLDFSSYKGAEASSYTQDEMRNLLLESGEWTAIRERPFNKVANSEKMARSLFVTAMDTNPLAPNPNIVLSLDKNSEYFQKGLEALTQLMGEKKIYVCTDEQFNLNLSTHSSVEHKKFSGPHPAGNVGTHIHFTDPVSINKSVWHIGYQDVIAIGSLLESGKISTQRYVSFGGPKVIKPQIYKTVRGAKISECFPAKLLNGNSKVRYISGSVFNGRTAQGAFDYIGRFANQVTVLAEGSPREFLGWHMPGANKFSLTRAFLSAFTPGKTYDFSTISNGSHRALLPLGSYEKVMPLDVMPTFLLRALLGGDSDLAQKLGALELDEEDLALCTFVDAGKTEFGPILSRMLENIEKDG